MKRTAAICVAIVLSLISSVFAEYSVWNSGKWPKSWPAELEPLRKHARTFEDPLESLPPPQHYAIPFTKRDGFALFQRSTDDARTHRLLAYSVEAFHPATLCGDFHANRPTDRAAYQLG